VTVKLVPYVRKDISNFSLAFDHTKEHHLCVYIDT